jgi:hypothetical protein
MSTRRCKNGTRKNKKTGECENIIINDNIPPQPVLQEPVQGTTEELVPIIIKKKKPKIVIEKPTLEEIPIVEETTSKKTNYKNNYLLQQEKQEYTDNFNVVDEILYPTLNDPNFTYKLSKHKEFFDNMYDGKIYDIRKQADLLCKADFELLPHQIFIKNFLSLQTPYNSLLLYNGLGSGKTCSAIGVTEEMENIICARLV